MNANKTMRMHIFWTLLAKICLEFEQRLVLDFFFFFHSNGLCYFYR